MKTFILLSAIPGSGKSTWSEQYKNTHPNTFVVSSDALRKELGGAYQNFNHEKEVWSRFLSDIEKYRDEYEDVTVIGDSTNIINKFRKYYAETLTGFDKKILVIIKKDFETLKRTNRERASTRILPDEALERLYNEWEDPTEEVKALYDEVIVVDKWFDSPNVDKGFIYK